MDFDQYVAARRATLVRVAALLGCPEHLAPRFVTAALSRSARRIECEDNPDPDVYRALVDGLREHRDAWPADPCPPEDHENADGLAVRRDLAGLDHLQRAAVVLLEHADLTPDETAYALREKQDTLTAATAAQQALGPDTRARLQTAADTVDVPPPETVERPRPARRWPWIAAVALLAVATVVTAASNGPEPPPDGRLDDDQIPSVFGYDRQPATARLQSLGLEVSQQSVHVCDPSEKVVDTMPPTGTRFEEGDEVVIRTAFPSGGSCQVDYRNRSDAWEFVDFATGRGPAPRFHDKLWLIVDRSEPAVLFGADSRDPRRWGDRSALTMLRKATAEVVREDGRWHTPTLFVEYGVPPRGRCGVPRPRESGGREALSLSVYVATDSTPDPCPATVDLYRGRSGGIDAVVLTTRR